MTSRILTEFRSKYKILTEFWPKIRSKYYFDRKFGQNIILTEFWVKISVKIFYFDRKRRSKCRSKYYFDRHFRSKYRSKYILTENFGQKFGQNFLTDRSKNNFDQCFSDRWFSVKISVKMANFGQNSVFFRSKFRSKLTVDFVVEILSST